MPGSITITPQSPFAFAPHPLHFTHLVFTLHFHCGLSGNPMATLLSLLFHVLSGLYKLDKSYLQDLKIQEIPFCMYI